MIIEQQGWAEQLVGPHPCVIYRPSRQHPHGFSLLYLHDLDHRVRDEDVDWEDICETHQVTLVAPTGGRAWWLDRIVSEFHTGQSPLQYLVQDILPFFAEALGVRPPQIGVWGIGMGGQGALRLSYAFPDLFPVVAAIAPAIDFHLLVRHRDPLLTEVYGEEEAARQDTALLHIHPLRWPRHQFFCCDPDDTLWYESSDRLRMKLASMGIRHECDLETTAGGDRSAYLRTMAARAAAFLVERLETEHRRIM